MILFLVGAGVFCGVCWRLSIMQDRWMTVCHTVNLSSSVKPDELFNRLTELTASEVVRRESSNRYESSRKRKTK